MVSVAATCGGAADGWDVLGLVAAASCGRAPGCAGAACAASRWARVRSGISLRIRARRNAAASSAIRYACRGGSAWANAEAMTCLRGQVAGRGPAG